MRWLFTPLTRAARGVDEWLNEDIRVTRGRGYEPYPYETYESQPLPDVPRRRSGASRETSVYDGRRAFMHRRSYDDSYGESYDESYEDDGIGAYRRDDGSEGWLAREREKKTPPAAAPRGEPGGAYSDSGEDRRRRRSSSNRRADARDWFRGLGDRFSSAPEDAPIDAREFERLRDRR